MEKNQKQVKMNVTVPEAQKTGVSANIAFLTVTSNGEAILDFIFSHPNDMVNDVQQGTLVSRVVLPLKVAKDLSFVLSSQLGKSIKE